MAKCLIKITFALEQYFIMVRQEVRKLKMPEQFVPKKSVCMLVTLRSTCERHSDAVFPPRDVSEQYSDNAPY